MDYVSGSGLLYDLAGGGGEASALPRGAYR